MPHDGIASHGCMLTLSGEPMVRALAAAVLLIMLGGCAASGVKVTEDQARQFERGKSTYADVVGKLGPPNSSVSLSSGMRVISYAYVEAAARPATFIPIVGAFVGGADARSNVVTFTFGPDGILTNYIASSSQTGTGLGASAGTNVQPVEDQPRKAQ